MQDAVFERFPVAEGCKGGDVVKYEKADGRNGMWDWERQDV